jgi:hypothetical protein
MVSSLFEALGEFPGALLHVTDWIWDSEYGADPTTALRETIGESRALIDVPGFLFDPSEFAAANDLGSLILKRGWTSYIYLTSGAATLLLWEGDLIDFWSREKRLAKQLKVLLHSIEARVVHDQEGPAA